MTHMVRHGWAVPWVVVATSCSPWLASADGGHVHTMEFVRVSGDGWNFERVPSGERFVPFGANLVFRHAGGLGLGLGSLTWREWDPDVIRQAFAGARSLNMNLLKVFLWLPHILPDPQSGEGLAFAELEPPLFDRVDYVFELAHEYDIYVSLTLGESVNQRLEWWQNGGGVLGRQSEHSAIDSFAILGAFWKVAAARYRDEPALFSYNLAAEFNLSGPHLGLRKSAEEWFLLDETLGLPAWREWLRSMYGDAHKLNDAWGTDYGTIDEVPQPDMTFVETEGVLGHYASPQKMIADFNTFKECVVYRFLRCQVEAIRSVDRRHMVTCGFHPAQLGIGARGWAKLTSGIVCRELNFLDYLATHLYTAPLDYSPGADAAVTERKRREAVMTARFLYVGKPVVIEEMGHIVHDRQETIVESIREVESLRGHASGFMLWFLSDLYPGGSDPAVEGPPQPYGPLGLDLKPNEFGQMWRKLAEPGGLVAELPMERAPARTVITLDRLEGLAPTTMTEAQKLLLDWSEYAHPVDFDWPGNPVLQKTRKADP